MMNSEELKLQIRRAFAKVEYPGDWCLRGSDEGSETFLLEDEFKEKMDWGVLPTDFLDRAPDGFASALSFFSDEAFRFYLPAYLIADIDGKLELTDPAWYLSYGLDAGSKHERINPRRYGERTLWDNAVHKHSIFNQEQAAVIVEYLLFVRKREHTSDDDAWRIDEALKNYWLARSGTHSMPRDRIVTDVQDSRAV